MRISDWSSDVCSSDLIDLAGVADLAAQLARRGIGGEDDGPSRALAKAAIRAGKHNPAIGLEVLAVRRPARFRRGGDHLPSLEPGSPAIRFTVGVEDYDHQHQDLRTESARKYGDTGNKIQRTSEEE